VGSNRLILYWLTVVVQSTTVKKFYGQVETFRQSSSTIGSAFQAFCFARVRCCFAKLLGCRHIRSEGSYQLFKGLTFWSLGRGCFIQRAGRQNNPRSKKHWTTNTLGRAMVFFLMGERILVSGWVAQHMRMEAHGIAQTRFLVIQGWVLVSLEGCHVRIVGVCFTFLYFIRATSPPSPQNSHHLYIYALPNHIPYTLSTHSIGKSQRYTQHHYSPSKFGCFFVIWVTGKRRSSDFGIMQIILLGFVSLHLHLFPTREPCPLVL